MLSPSFCFGKDRENGVILFILPTFLFILVNGGNLDAFLPLFDTYSNPLDPMH